MPQEWTEKKAKVARSYESLLSPIWPGLELERISQPGDLSEAEIEIFRGIADTYLHFFTVFVVGYDRFGGVGSFHWDMCKRLQAPTKPMLELDYRGAFKTTAGSICAPLWGAAKDPGGYDHLLVVSDLPLGKDILETQAKLIEGNQVLRTLYPEMRPLKTDWSGTSRSLQGRDVEKMGPTFEVRTTKQSLAGRHRQRITFEDWVNEDNCMSRNVQSDFKRRVDYIWPTLNNRELARELVGIGTRYADFDVWGYMIEQLWPNDLDVFMQPVRGTAHLDSDYKTVLDDDGVYAHEEEWDDERYDQLLRMVGDTYIVRCQFFLDTRRHETLGFKQEWKRYHKFDASGEPIVPHMTIYCGVDPASGADTPDATAPAIGVCGIDDQGDIHILFSSSEYHSEVELVEAVFQIWRRYKPTSFKVECYGTSGYGLLQHIERRMRAKGIYLPIEKTTRGHLDKDEAIRELLRPLYQWHQVVHHPSLKNSEYEKQLDAFPGGAKKDELDAMYYAVREALEVGYLAPRKERAASVDKRGVPIGYTRDQLTQLDLVDEDADRAGERVPW